MNKTKLLLATAIASLVFGVQGAMGAYTASQANPNGNWPLFVGSKVAYPACYQQLSMQPITADMFNGEQCAFSNEDLTGKKACLTTSNLLACGQCFKVKNGDKSVLVMKVDETGKTEFEMNSCTAGSGKTNGCNKDASGNPYSMLGNSPYEVLGFAYGGAMDVTKEYCDPAVDPSKGGCKGISSVAGTQCK